MVAPEAMVETYAPALTLVRQTSEILLAIGAVLSIIITQIVTTKLNSMTIENLAKHVAKQNGKLGRTANRMRRLEIRCAAIHGLPPSLDDDDDEEDDEG